MTIKRLINVYASLCTVILGGTITQASLANDIDLDLESLMAEDVQVTSAMKRAQSIKHTAASIYVLSADKIIKSGAQTLPDMLRLVPGMQVRSVDQNQQAIGVRFASNSYASKLLVMIDGQSIYNPAFLSTYWELEHIAPESIERIEIIRGQTGTLWGLNALNGVINIITKQNVDKPKFNVSTYGNSINAYSNHASVNLTLNSKTTVNVYGSRRANNSSSHTSNDHSVLQTLGVRTDYVPTDNLYSLFKVDFVDADHGQTARVANLQTHLVDPIDETVSRQRLTALARTEHRLNDHANQMLQLNFAKLDSEQVFSNEDHTTFDLDYQLNTLWHDHQIDWGINYRYNDINIAKSPHTFDLASSNIYQTIGVFAQGQFNIVDDHLSLILSNGSANNSYTGWEHQPAIRLLATPSSHHTFWLSYSRAVRPPSYLEYDGKGRIGGQPVGIILQSGIEVIDQYVIATFFEGSPNSRSEVSLSKEVGYRFENHKINLDLAVFQTHSRNVLSYEAALEGTSFEALANLISHNDITTALMAMQQSSIVLGFIPNVELDTYGGEISASGQLRDNWNVELSYSLTDMEYGQYSPATRPGFSRNSTLKQTSLTSSLQITPQQHLFISVRHEEGATYNTGSIISSQLAWQYQLNDHNRFTVSAKNLFDQAQYEYLNVQETQTQPAQRSSQVGIYWNVEF